MLPQKMFSEKLSEKEILVNRKDNQEAVYRKKRKATIS